MESMGNALKSILATVERSKQKHQSNTAELEKKYECPICEDEQGSFQMLPFKDSPDLVEQWVNCSCVLQKRASRMITASRISPEFRKKTFDNFTTVKRPQCILEAYATAKEYVELFPNIRHTEQNSLALLGKPGSGKTHLLMAVSNQLIDSGVGVLYFPWVEGWNDIRSDMDQLDGKVRMLQEAEVLFVDDLFKGRKRPTDFELVQFFSVVNYRYLNNRPMLISSERDFDELIDPQIGDEALGSRLYERCKAFAVTLGGEESLNYRMRAL